MDKQFRYYAITFRDGGKNKVIYVARSERERINILKCFSGTEERNQMQQVDITRSRVLPNSQIGFQAMEFWLARQNLPVAA
jgi:hypothetical protein